MAEDENGKGDRYEKVWEKLESHSSKFESQQSQIWELRSMMIALKDQHTDCERLRVRLEDERDKMLDKLDDIGQKFHAFLLQNATQIQQFTDNIKAAHRRLDSYDLIKKWMTGVAATIVATGILGLLAFLLGLFKKTS